MNWKDFSQIYLPDSFTSYTMVHQPTFLLYNKYSSKEGSKLSSIPGCCDFSHIFCTFRGGQVKHFSRNYCKPDLLKGLGFFSGLKEAKRMMCLECPITG